MESVPAWYTYLASVLFGLVAGSFLNVVIVRLPKKKSVVTPGSRCVKCQNPISWYDNLPLISYLLLRGKCRRCGKPISIRYPIIELLCSILFLAATIHSGWNFSTIVREWPFLWILLAVTFIDLEHRIIPDVLSLGGLALGILTCWMDPRLGWIECILGAILGFSVFYLIAWLYFKLRNRSGLGGGDIKFLAMLGAFLGPYGIFATMFVSSIFGSIVGIGLAWVQGKKDLMQISLPFGPFLVIGALFYYLLGDLLWLPFMIPM